MYVEQNSSDHVRFDEGGSNYAPISVVQTDTTSSIARALGVTREVANMTIIAVCLIIIAISVYVFIHTRPAPPPTPEDIQALEDALRVNR